MISGLQLLCAMSTTTLKDVTNTANTKQEVESHDAYFRGLEQDVLYSVSDETANEAMAAKAERYSLISWYNAIADAMDYDIHEGRYGLNRKLMLYKQWVEKDGSRLDRCAFGAEEGV